MAKELTPIGGPHFSSVRRARAAIRERAFELLSDYITVLKQAASAGDYETAVKGYQHLLEHMPDEDGEKMIDISIDKPKQVDKGSGPSIQIGFQLGGLPTQPQLQESTFIDVEPIKKLE